MTAASALACCFFPGRAVALADSALPAGIATEPPTLSFYLASGVMGAIEPGG